MIDHDCPPYEEQETYVAKTDKDMIDHVTEFFFGGVLDIAEVPSPEQPEQPSTETMADEIEGTPATMPIEPLTDLTGVDYAPAFEGYQPNGALPETD